jgi:hypothetical protein
VVSGYFEKLKVGDLVVVPPAAFSQPALIGEVESPPELPSSMTVQRLYGNDMLSGRSVRWLARIEKRKLPNTVLDALEHPTAIYLLARSQRAPIVGAVVGGIATSYFGLIQHSRTVVEADFSTLKKTAEDLRPLLYAYRRRLRLDPLRHLPVLLSHDLVFVPNAIERHDGRYALTLLGTPTVLIRLRHDMTQTQKSPVRAAPQQHGRAASHLGCWAQRDGDALA